MTEESILVISDTHRMNSYIREVVAKETDYDRVIHLGDLEGNRAEVDAILKKPVIYVNGNCDYDGMYPSSRMIELGNHQVFLTHGHLYAVRYTRDKLMGAAMKNRCDVVMFGHSHVPVNVWEKGVRFFNPGSLSLPRQEGFAHTYGIVKVKADGELTFEIRQL